MLRGMHFVIRDVDMDSDMALERAIGIVIAGDIGVCLDAGIFEAAYRNSNADFRTNHFVDQ